MPSDVDIANYALRLTGTPKITSLTQGIPRSDIVNDIYAVLRDSLLEFPWNFSTIRVKLAQLTATPVFGFDFAYGLPSDWIYTVSVHPDDSNFSRIPYKEEQVDNQNVLLANSTDLFLRYARKETDPNKWSTKFVTAFAIAIARDTAIALTDSNVLYVNLEKRAARALGIAKSADGIKDFPDRRPRGNWANSRNFGINGFITRS